MGYYSAQNITKHVTLITSMTKELLFLIEGEREAVLIDTCLGVGDLREFVESLTSKPISVILTHGHVDHAMGAPEFDTVYMSSKDNHVFIAHQDLSVRKEYIQMTLGDNAPQLEDHDFVQPRYPDFKELNDEDTFDLGGVRLEIYAAAGHTPGMMTVLIVEERTLILGDACNHSTFLFDEHSSSIEKYRRSLENLYAKTQGKIDRVYLSHHVVEASSEILQETIKLCGEIIRRETDDIPFVFMGKTSYIAKAVDPSFKRLDGGIGNIIYDKNKIFEK